MSAGKRIRREAEQLRKKPCREFLAYPSEDNEFVWMFTIRGPEESPYEEGAYHGKLLLPMNYPYGPPDVLLLTPNGRFETNTKICLSEVTSYHPENWQPSWGVHTVLHALREFMKTPGNNAIGAIDFPESECKRLAQESRGWVSPQGARMADHLSLLDSSPPWADRNNAGGGGGGGGETPPASTPTPTPTPTPVPASGASDGAGEPVDITPVPPPVVDAEPVGGRQAAPPAATVEQVPQAAWQLQESSLNNFILLLLTGIFIILSKKYIEAMPDTPVQEL